MGWSRQARGDPPRDKQQCTSCRPSTKDASARQLQMKAAHETELQGGLMLDEATSKRCTKQFPQRYVLDAAVGEPAAAECHYFKPGGVN